MRCRLANGNIYLGLNKLPAATDSNYNDYLALIVHEAKHLEQGPWLALSVYGELEAWQT